MSIIDWVAFMIGVDRMAYPEYDFLIVGTSCALLIILFSSIYTFLMTMSGIFSRRS